MKGIELRRVSMRRVRAKALAPKAALFGVLGILAIAGLRSAVAGPAPSAPAPPPRAHATDQAVEAFAEGWARAYLTWDARNSDERQQRLATFPMAGDASQDGGLTPGPGSQRVRWSAVLSARASAGDRTLVTVVAETSGADGTVYLDVPVARDKRGQLYIAGYPALVGPPATAPQVDEPTEADVEDRGLTTVVDRAVTNYLAGARDNLLADLAPGAVVSLPRVRMRVTATNAVTWVTEGRRVAVRVDAQDGAGAGWTLRYELEVQKRDRWYVRSLQVDPTYPRGGS